MLDTIQLLLPPGNKEDVPMKIAWVLRSDLSDQTRAHPGSLASSPENYDVLWGHELEKRINNKTVELEDVIAFFKMALYDEFDDSPEVKLVREQLQRYGFNNFTEGMVFLLTEVFRSIWRDVLQSIHDMNLRQQWPDIAEYEKEVLITLPSLLAFRASNMMRMAATKAGLPRLRFVSEAAAASAYFLEKIVQNFHPERAKVLQSVCSQGAFLISDVSELTETEWSTNCSRGCWRKYSSK